MGNVHSLSASIIDELALPGNISILDLGAGEGAFSVRLSDHGFTDIEACEIISDRFRVPGIQCHQIDLNDPDFSKLFKKKYDLLIAIELIEHLENPSRFLLNLQYLVKPHGYLLISSPNVASWYSRLLFLRYGRLHWFDKNSHQDSGHIHPIFDWQIEILGEDAGFKKVLSTHTKDRFLFDRYIFPHGILRALLSRLTYLLLLLPLMKNDKSGEIKLWLLQKQ